MFAETSVTFSSISSLSSVPVVTHRVINLVSAIRSVVRFVSDQILRSVEVHILGLSPRSVLAGGFHDIESVCVLYMGGPHSVQMIRVNMGAGGASYRTGEDGVAVHVNLLVFAEICVCESDLYIVRHHRPAGCEVKVKVFTKRPEVQRFVRDISGGHVSLCP